MYLHHIDANGIDHLDQYQGYNQDEGNNPPSVIYFSSDGGATWNSGSPTYWDDAVGANTLFRFNNYAGAYSSGDELLIAFEVDPASTEYILEWNSTNGRWEINSGSYVKLSTLKTEVAASVDFADFQSQLQP